MKRAVAHVAAIGFLAVVVAAFVPVFPCTMLEHFRVHYVVGGIPVAVAAYFFAPRCFDAALIAVLVQLAIVAPDLGSSAVTKQGTRVRVLFANVLTSNTQHARVARLIVETQPDVIALVETNQIWFDALAPALAGYERLEHPRRDNFGCALYARGAVRGRIEHLESELPAIVAEVVLASGPRMNVVVVHPWPPVSGWAEDEQHTHLAAIASRVRTLSAPIVLAGDLNATPWSRAYAKLVGATGLCDTRAGFGYQGSFPASSVLVRIPIDHVLVSCSIGVRDRAIGPDVGSDHLPVIVDLAF